MKPEENKENNPVKSEPPSKEPDTSDKPAESLPSGSKHDKETEVFLKHDYYCVFYMVGVFVYHFFICNKSLPVHNYFPSLFKRKNMEYIPERHYPLLAYIYNKNSKAIFNLGTACKQ